MAELRDSIFVEILKGQHCAGYAPLLNAKQLKQKGGIGAEGGNRTAFMFYSVFPLFLENPSKVTLSVCAYCAFGAFRPFSCDSDVTPTF
jgi:hypothetical protein